MNGGICRLPLSRRAFLVSAGAVTIGIGLAAGYGATNVESGQSGLVINAFLSILPDGRVQFVCPAQDLGQGAPLALSMIVAEEMGADLGMVEVISAPRDDERYGNPDFGGRMVTADSKTTSGYYLPLRLAGCEARRVLIETACNQQGWKATDCLAVGHRIVHRPTGTNVTFADIAAGGFLKTPGSPDAMDLKASANFSLLGSSPISGDSRDIVMGRKCFGVDFRDKATSIALLERSPHLGGTLVDLDDAAARAVPGVEDVVRLDDAVAVVASDTWSALKGRAALKAVWSSPAAFDSVAERNLLMAALDDQGLRRTILRDIGTDPETLSFSAVFYAPTLKHVVMEPLNATAKGTHMGLGVEISSSTQSLDLDMRFAAQSWKTAPFMVKVTGRPSGGAFGRRVLNDAVRDAALVAKKLGRPVQVIRPMQDELKRGQVRPAAVQRISAGLSPKGELVGWRHEIASDGTLATHLPASLKGAGHDEDNTATDGAYHNYRTPYDLIRWTYVASKPSPGFLRGVSAGYTVWAIETMVERLARACGRDPLEWRQAHLDDPRLLAVLERVAEMSEWGAKGRHLGIGSMSFRGSTIATVAEVTGQRVSGLWIAADVGRIIHRNNVLAQIEGGAVWGLSMALTERLVYAEGRAMVESLADYPIIPLDEIPPIRIDLIEDQMKSRPGGAGEIGVPTVIPAICNAMEAATGRSFDSLPLAL